MPTFAAQRFAVVPMPELDQAIRFFWFFFFFFFFFVFFLLCFYWLDVLLGGLKILPDIKLDECSIESTDTLILPGGDTLDRNNSPTHLKNRREVFKGRYIGCSDLWCYNGTCPDRIAEFTWAYKQ